MDTQPKKSSVYPPFLIVLIGAVALLLTACSPQDNDSAQPEIGNTNSEQPAEDASKKNSGDFETTGETKAFTGEQLSAATSALAQGIRIEDPQNDWLAVAEGTTQPDGKEDNADPYPLGWTDLRSATIGADNEYLYVKYEFWDSFPSKPFAYNGDVMDGTVAKINTFTFTNAEGKSDTADLIASMSLRSFGNGKILGVDLTAMISPQGEDEQRETRFTTYSKDGRIAGGPNENYLLGAFPLSEFELRLGDTVIFDCSTESGSEKYHHEAIDILLSEGNSKFGKQITYTLGSSTYTSAMPKF